MPPHANVTYLSGRKKYARPQAMVFANSIAIDSETGLYYPEGTEYQDFLVLSDHNRSEIQMAPERVEVRKRMINGRMRSVWLADKLKISTSWKDLPSRVATAGVSIVDGKVVPNNFTDTDPEPDTTRKGDIYVVDSGAAAADLAQWHKDHPGSFWVLVSFDDPNEVGGYDKIAQYTMALECFFDDFKYDISKRGRRMDLWNVSLSLEEV